MTTTAPVWSWALVAARAGQDAARGEPLPTDWSAHMVATLAARRAQDRGMPQAAVPLYVAAFCRGFRVSGRSENREAIVAVHSTLGPPMAARLPKYLPLCQYLEQLPAEQQSVRLGLAEIEALLGSPLPLSAVLSGYWTGGPMADANWRRSGWHARIYRPAAVLFTRLTETP